MKVYYKEWQQFLPMQMDEVWHFFSRPENLNAITPEDMHFEILSDIANQKMYQGMIIKYKISPFLGIKMNWTTEITHVRENEYFIDEQRFGPYALWHHQHHFIPKDEGVLMFDKLHYAIPFGPIGQIANAIFVANKVESIFQYRKKAIAEVLEFDKRQVAV